MVGLQRFREGYPKTSAILVGGAGIPLEEYFSRDPMEWFS